MQSLTITQRMIDSAKDNKAAGLLRMRPEDFLFLTVGSDDHHDMIKRHTQPLDQYNEWAKQGVIINMPSLKISCDGDAFGQRVEVGKVLSHEGRHRAQSIINAGGNYMIVAITAAFGGYARYKIHEGPEDMKQRYIRASDFPATWYGEFQHHRKLTVDLSNMRSLWGK